MYNIKLTNYVPEPKPATSIAISQLCRIQVWGVRNGKYVAGEVAGFGGCGGSSERD